MRDIYCRDCVNFDVDFQACKLNAISMRGDAKRDCVKWKELRNPTNADRIRAMSDEELANWLYDRVTNPGSYDRWLKWLKKEAEE